MAIFITVDVETTSLDQKDGSILSIGAVNRKTRKEYYGECRIWPGALVEKSALGINGFTQDEITDDTKKSELELLEEFFSWVGNKSLLIGMNPNFDYLFLKYAALRGNKKKILFSHRTLDLHTLAVIYACINRLDIPETGFATDQIYAMLNMPPEPRPHDAMVGARMENEAFTKLIKTIVMR